MRAGAQRRPGGGDQSRHRAGGKAGNGAVDRSGAPRSGGDDSFFIVIPGRRVSVEPGMTKNNRERTMANFDRPLARRTVIKGAGLGLVAGALADSLPVQSANAAT